MAVEPAHLCLGAVGGVQDDPVLQLQLRDILLQVTDVGIASIGQALEIELMRYPVLDAVEGSD